MRRFSRQILGAGALALLGLAAQAQTATKRLIGDYGYWSRTQTPPYSSAQIPFDKLTHINHAGVSFDANGNLVVPSGFLEPELISKGHAAGVRVLLLLGGDFAALETGSTVLAALLGNLQTFITANGYDGVDVDWEYPSTAADATAFHDLMKGLRGIFPSPRYTLSADVPPWGGGGYDYKGVEPVVDYYNVMMYDCAGPWTSSGQLNSAIFLDPRNPQPYECSPGGSVDQAAKIFLNVIGIPAVKLNMGSPFYGYWYRNVTELFGLCNPCNGHTVLAEPYGTFIKQRINQQGWRTYHDREARVPYMLRTDGQPGYITYDDQVSTYHRVWYSVWERDLGGTFLWSLDQDYDGQTQDLLESMYLATQRKTLAAAE